MHSSSLPSAGLSVANFLFLVRSSLLDRATAITHHSIAKDFVGVELLRNLTCVRVSRMEPSYTNQKLRASPPAHCFNVSLNTEVPACPDDVVITSRHLTSLSTSIVRCLSHFFLRAW